MAQVVNHQNERSEMLKAFDATKSGVKGLIDSGLSTLPQIFVRPSDELTYNKTAAQLEVPLVDLTGIHNNPERRKLIVEEVRIASETLGFFQVTNHGIPQTIIDEMIDGVNKFHEMDADEKAKYYTRDPRRKVKFATNHDLFNSRTANWRDTLGISFGEEIPSDELPPPCRESTLNYSKHVKILGGILLELLSEALGLKVDYLKKMKCADGHLMSCHYYPACPQPELAIGTPKHSDIGFITILLQNQINGLQVMYEDRGWIDVHPLPGGLVVNIGDLLQLVSNGRFISGKHRVEANSIGPRISVATFFSGPLVDSESIRYGPIKELISQQNTPKYKEIIFGEYVLKFSSTGLDQYLGLDYYKL